MCGICGIINSELPESTNIEIVERMCNSMTHRGPDDWGVKSFGSSCLGMRRLSIIDTSPKGHQPMSNEDETLWVVCNGEIYNFREKTKWLKGRGHLFRSEADVEVILHLYEEFDNEFLNHLRGMFAFAFWDENKKEFYLVRDRLGIKPVYYSENNGTLLFASELRALICSGLIKPEIDLNSLDYYLSFGYVPQPYTLLNKIRFLLPGHFLYAKDKHIEITKYWDFPKSGDTDIRFNEIIPKTRQLLEESILLHQVSDVPIGAFLSGGIDSSAMVGLMSSLSDEPVRTFSIGFEQTPSHYNELDIARITSRRFKTKHSEVIVTGQDVLNEIDNIIGYIDQPSFDGINSYFVSKAAKEGGVTVALSGLGGDELFGGYGSYKTIPKFANALKLWGRIPINFKKSIVNIISMQKTFGLNKSQNKKISRMVWADTPIGLYAIARLLLWPEEKKQLYSSEMNLFLSSNQKRQTILELLTNTVNLDSNLWHIISELEMQTYMSWRLLRDTDVMSMAHSLEVRVPIIDHKLVEFICGLPSGWEKSLGFPKRLLKKALSDILPQEVLNQPKHGFEFPLEIWMKNELKPLVEDTLSETTIKNRGLFKHGEIFRLYQSFLKGELSYPIIWQFVVLELWMQNFLDGNSKSNLTPIQFS